MSGLSAIRRVLTQPYAVFGLGHTPCLDSAIRRVWTQSYAVSGLSHTPCLNSAIRRVWTQPYVVSGLSHISCLDSVNWLAMWDPTGDRNGSTYTEAGVWKGSLIAGRAVSQHGQAIMKWSWLHCRSDVYTARRSIGAPGELSSGCLADTRVVLVTQGSRLLNSDGISDT